MDFNFNEIFDEIEKVSADTKSVTVEVKPKFSEEAVFVPLSYQIFSLDSNKRREIVDTYLCDRERGIVPNLKAKKKADLMQKAFPNKTFFVEGEYAVVEEGKAVVKHVEIIHETKK
jgi:hypothetical protein